MIRSITLHTPHGPLHGQLDRPENPCGLIILARAHHVPGDLLLAAHLVDQGFALFTMELLSNQEIQFPDATQNVPRLTQRLLDILDLTRRDGDMGDIPLAILANGDTSPAAIRAAAQRDTQVKALACHGGLIDRAGLQALKLLTAPLLGIFEADDNIAITAFKRAEMYLRTIHKTHVLEMSEDPSRIVNAWFLRYLASAPRPAEGTLEV